MRDLKHRGRIITASVATVATAGLVLLFGLLGGGLSAASAAVPVVSVESQTVIESDRNQSIRVDISLDTPSTENVRVRYTTVAGTATENEDYTRRTGFITIPRNQTSRTATIVIRGDDDDEPAEQFQIVLSDPTNAELGSNGTITIEDDDEPFVAPTVSAVSQTVTETDRNQVVRVTIELDRPAERTTRVRYTTVEGSATENRDFTRRTALATIGRNRQSVTVPITIRGDLEMEGTEEFQVVLSDPVDATIGSDAVITIEDNDDQPLPVVSVVPLEVTETERNQVARVTITLDKVAQATTRVRYTLVDGTATVNQDYSRRSGTATIARNRSEVTIPVVIRGDDVQEPTETLLVQLSAPTGADLGDDGVVTIVDNDDPPFPWLGWFDVVRRDVPPSEDIHDLDASTITGDQLAAINDALDQHGEVRLLGTFDLDGPLLLESGQILRGGGPDQTTLRFTGVSSGIRADLGAINGPRFGVAAAPVGDKQLVLDSPDTSGAFQVGGLVVLAASDPNADPLTMEVAAIPDPSTLILTGPLPRAVDATEEITALNRDPVVGVGIDGMTLRAVGSVDDLIFFRGVVGGWVNNVVSENPRRAHITVTFSRGCHVSGSFFDNASAHGDGARGYGISLANGTTGCLVEDNELRRLRHALIVNEGAGGNAFVHNHAWEAFHPNFPAGGPPDLLLHGPAYGNLFEGNVVERILIGDRETNGGNVFLRNCLTTSPLGYQHGFGTQVILRNAMYGSDAELLALRMEDRWPDHEPFPDGETTRPFLQPGTTIFDGNGVVRIIPVTGVSPLPDPVVLNNWFDEAPTGPQTTDRLPVTVFTGLQDVLTGPQTSDWTVDCPIDAAAGAGRGQARP